MAHANNLITKTVAKTLPELYAQESLGDAAVAHVKFFGIWKAQGRRWYLTEYRPEEELAFGIVFTPECPDGELGYTSVAELQEMNDNFRQHGYPCPLIERDLHFRPLTLREIKAKMADGVPA